MNIAILCSGSGTNLQAIIDAVKERRVKASIAIVISDRPGAYALTRAKNAGIESLFIDPGLFKTKEEYDRELIRRLAGKKAGLVVLAGYMRLLTPHFVSLYRDRIMNIHPSLLPSFKGKYAVRDALRYGAKVTGATVHFVTEELDSGPIIAQAACEITPGDTEETLLERVHCLEHIIYPKAIALFVEGRTKVKGGRTVIAGKKQGAKKTSGAE